jgi:hypothetical protein
MKEKILSPILFLLVPLSLFAEGSKVSKHTNSHLRDAHYWNDPELSEIENTMIEIK